MITEHMEGRHPGPVQLITPEGERVSNPGYDPWVRDVGDGQLVSLYTDMMIIRRLDTEATALQRQGELALWPPLLGQEAAQVGSARVLDPADFVFPSYRENGVAWCRGVECADLVRMWRGNAASGWNPYSVNIATQQIIIGAQTLHATGYAMGIQLDGAAAAAIAYFGDGATSQGDTNEALVFAASFQVPVVFFCQNNHWAISEPVVLQSRTRIADRALGFGIPSMQVDGNDVLAVMAATRIALDRARKGGGPTFIEAVTYRMGPHTTADDPTRYRDANELEDWAGRDPVKRVKALLESRGVLTGQVADEVDRKASDVAQQLRRACEDMPDPAPLEVFRHVYSLPNSWLDRQEEHYARYLAFLDDPAAAPAAEGAPL